ncbi:hypothetical protein NNO_1190 [Hydrogenimonas sp.]|nr:hypothetical protein NNO_1190 [Hydrogenimonas sp.]
MNRWQQKFEEHPIHETLRQLEESVSKEFEDIGEQEAIERRRFLKIIAMYQEVLKGLDSELVPMNQLDNLNDGLRQANIWNQVTDYVSNRNPAHLIRANDHLTNLLTPLSLLFAISKKMRFSKPFRKAEELVDEFSKTIVSQKDTLQNELKSLSGEVADCEQKLQKLERQIEARKNETDTLISQWQSQFSEAQERRNTDYAAWREKVDKQAASQTQEVIDKSEETLKSHQSAFEEEISAIIKDADAKHKAILELYELTAGDSVGAGYIKSADKEMKQANTWRWIAIGFIVTTVLWLAFVYFCNAGSFDFCHFGAEGFWIKIVTAFSLTGVMLYGAAYASQQSTKHRNNEKRARWFALEIKAFDPFISSLKEDQRQELKRQLSERLFGHHEDGDDEKVIDEHVYKTVIDGIVRVIEKIPKIH